jgi:riboflavin biosynthesis pyrimidine reductase
MDGKILANLLVAANGATTQGGRSAPLSPPDDRRRFHAIRSQAKAIVIGGNTFRHEPYSRTPIPLYVATSHPPLDPRLEESGSTALRCFLNKAPTEVVERALAEQGAPILVEGGVGFLTPLIEKKVIDSFYLTRVLKKGDGNFFDDALLRKYYLLTHSEVENDTIFEVWKPR